MTSYSQYNKLHGSIDLENIDALTKHITEKSNILFLSGAGVSVSCGVGTYRGKNGIFDKLRRLNIKEIQNPEDIFTRSFREKHPDIMKMPEIINILNIQTSAIQSISHKLPMILIEKGYKAKVITQNIDGLYSNAGLTLNENLIEFHGSYNQQNVVLYGDEIDDNVTKLAYEWCRQADILIVMGTSLKVAPFAALPNVPMKHCVRVLIDIKPYQHRRNIWTKCGEYNENYISSGIGTKTYVTFPGKNKVTLRTEWGSGSISRKYKNSFIFGNECDEWSKALIKEID